MNLKLGINESLSLEDTIDRDLSMSRLSGGMCPGPAEISSYDFWVKCAPVSAHIRLKEANLNS